MANPNEKKLSIYAKQFLKSEMGRKLVKVSDLSKILGEDAIILGNKINRGAFSAGFLLHALQALELKDLPIPPKSQDYKII